MSLPPIGSTLLTSPLFPALSNLACLFTIPRQTRVLTHRIAHLIHVHGAQPWQVLAITFTNKVKQGKQI